MAGGSEDAKPREGGEAGGAGKPSDAPIALRPGRHRVIAALVALATLAAVAFWRCG